MPLLKKENCSICGKEIGLLGKVKLEDGFLCGSCSSKMSPFISGKKKMTVKDVETHLAYRESNKEVLAHFNPDFIRGNDTKIYIESGTGRFIVSKESDWRSKNPDVITRTMLNAVDVEVKESKDEVRRELEDGTYESYDPKVYEYEYTFIVHLHVDHPWFKEIDFELSDPDDRPRDMNDEKYVYCDISGKEIQHALIPSKYKAPDTSEDTLVTSNTTVTTSADGDEWVCECGQVNTGKFCSACGKPKPTRWFCPDCGTENHGAFCVNCGRKKPE